MQSMLTNPTVAQLDVKKHDPRAAQSSPEQPRAGQNIPEQPAQFGEIQRTETHIEKHSQENDQNY